MKTQDARWLRIRHLFETAIELSPERRDAFIDEHCASEPDLRTELKSLLASDSGSTRGPLTGAIGAAVDATTRDRREQLVGSVIGPYRLSSILGHGGAGTVYLGERADRQYSAQVAIKVVEGAALNGEISRRFRSERQILANLNHANIARLIDAGETPQGYPYLVMEYVHGESIDRYCDRMQLPIGARVELMLRVCSAVQYAHQNLVVHRDIKPANILVTPDGTPKLLDFGIAKLLDTDAMAAELALTRMNDRVLTPEYASPEQILGQPVTTASDVYALGMVLYELLTGLRPYKVSSASQLELERTICVMEPAKPSAAIRQAAARRPLTRTATGSQPSTRDVYSIAEARQTAVHRLVTRLGGDLDAILLRALRKEPIYRYPSVEQLSADLRRHLAREPVLARQGNWLYYAQRFTRRHALAVSTTAVFMLLLAGAVIVTSVQAKRIAEERDVATREKQTSEAVANFMVNVFTATDPYMTQTKDTTAAELLDRSTQSIRADLNQQPAVKARLLEAMGRTYDRQGQTERGIALLEESLTLRAQLVGSESPSLASTLITLAKAKLNRNDFVGAEQALVTAKDMLEQGEHTRTPDYAILLQRFAELAIGRGQGEAALRYLEASLSLVKEIYGPRDAEYASALAIYANALGWANRMSDVERYAREAVEIYRLTKPETHPDRISAQSLLVETLLYNNRAAEAELFLEENYRVAKQLFDNKSPHMRNTLMDLIQLRKLQQRYAEAESLAREMLATTLNARGSENVDAGQDHEILGGVLLASKKAAEAETHFQTALATYRQLLEADHPYIATTEYLLAEALIARRKPTQAIEQLGATIARLQRSNAAAWRIARAESTLGQALLATGKAAEAKDYLERSYKVLSNSPEVKAEAVRSAFDRLEQHYVEQRNTAALTKLRLDLRTNPKLSK